MVLYRTIQYYTKVGLARPSAPEEAEGSAAPQKTARFQSWKLYTKVGPARSSARAGKLGSGNPLENYAISIPGVADYIALYYNIL